MDRLQKFIKIEFKRLREKIKCTDSEFILANTVKLSEEVGEVCNEVLKHFKYARKEKLESILKN